MTDTDRQLDYLKNSLFELGPRGIRYMNGYYHLRLMHEYVIPGWNVATKRIYPDVLNRNDKEFMNSLMKIPKLFRFISSVLIPMPKQFRFRAAYCQNKVHQTIIVCGLERYRIAKGTYPETLDQLVPTYLETMPNDVCSGNPMIYQRTAKDRFKLYSVGWNEVDDQGVSDPKVPMNGKDWVWQWPDEKTNSTAK